MMHLLLIGLALLVSGCGGFLISPTTSTSNRVASTTTTTVMRVLPVSVTTPEEARGYFGLWFFGGSGGIGIAARQFPEQFRKFRQLTIMSGDGPTEGGETVGISPLCLYPRDISKADLDKVLNNKLSVEKMVQVGPKPNYLSQNGYLCYTSFVAANANCNPLTVRAVFDSISTSDIIAPDVAQTKLDEFANDISPDKAAFKTSLLQTKLAGFSSIAFLLFLLGPIGECQRRKFF